MPREVKQAVFGFLLGLAVLAGLLLVVSAAVAQGTFFDSLYYDSREKRLVDVPKLADAGFRILASNFTPDDQPVLKLCQDRGLSVVYETNTGLPADHKKNFDAFPCIKWWQVQDDMDLVPGNTPDKVKAIITAMKPFLRADMKTFGTFSKGAKPETWANVTDVAHIQLYIYKEGTLRKWYWEYVLAWRAAHKGLLWVGPYLGKSSAPFFGLKDPVWSEESFTPIAYNETAIWLALCAGADDWVGYSAYSISNALPAFSYRLTDRWDLLPGYSELMRQVKSYERFFTSGTRTTFDNGRVVGAVWMLPSGESLRVECDTFESKPGVRIDVIPAPVKTNVVITSSGPIKVEAKP